MKNEEFRKLTPEAQYELKKAVVKMVASGKTQLQAAEFFGVGHRSVSRWVGQFSVEGKKGLQPKTRGRRVGQKRTLSPLQETAIQRMIVDKCPEQLKLPFALWTRKAVQELIEHHYGLLLPIRTIGEYLKRWGFTPQKPLRRAYEQRPAVVREWLDEQFPEIQKRAKMENAQIYWGDESGLSSEDNRGRGYAPKGKTPVRYTTGARFSTSMISAIANQGQLRFMVYKGALNIDLFIQFLKRLIKDARQKVFLIVDNLRVHHAKKVQQWVKEHISEIELFYLPPYTPERNPDEYLNQDIKVSLGNKKAPRSQSELINNVRSHLKGLQKKKTKVANFFQHELVKYAA
jgi:transposase